MRIKKYPIILLLGLIILGVFVISMNFKDKIVDNSWISELGYTDDQIHSLTFNFKGDRGCPEIPVALNNKEYRLLFDTGCGSGIALTNVVEDSLDYELIGKVQQLNRDGSHRGWSKQVLLKELKIFGESYKNIETAIVDWQMSSSKEFSGLVGLEYFIGRIITLDYTGYQMGIRGNPIDYSSLNKKEYIILPLHKSTEESQKNLLFFEAKYKGELVIVYLDTGKNHSFLYNPNSTFAMGGNVPNLRNINIEVGDLELELSEIGEVHDIAQAQGLPYKTMIELNSDQIWKSNLLVTFDLIEGNIILSKR
ncbi:pepsin/retropepsin-like aspartic protease family protein [Vallitalea okinawensis]|uniref:hypothetical protein n=1 Tax=Vallitalea okinawensis TaxID=2078660 RepID=UPI000CFDC13B|nr:hypothetical protein [Vallitalea okinawensis]